MDAPDGEAGAARAVLGAAASSPVVRQRRPSRCSRDGFGDAGVVAAFFDDFVSRQLQRSARGTPPRTCSTWAPHPAQVGFLHVEHVVILHIPSRVSVVAGHIPPRVCCKWHEP
jgi:hypothetical protein